MTDKSLKSKAIKIQGKSYVLVSDRVSYFNETYPNGMIQTLLVSNENGKVVMKAVVVPDIERSTRYFTGYSQADEKQGMVNKTAAIENCETSAVGRALAMMGIGVIDSIASVDELKKASVASPNAPQTKVTAKPTSDTSVACGVCGGATTFREGTNKDGKKWQGYFCNTDRNHQPKFVSVKQDELVDKVISDY